MRDKPHNDQPKAPQQQPQRDAKSGPNFEIRRIYVRDLSFEAPNAPKTFEEEWHPEVELNLQTESKHIREDLHEVVLTVTAKATVNHKPAFVAEVHQAGVFSMSGFVDEQQRQLLGSFCPNILFPYAREAISDIVVRGGFPQLLLAPVNFDALYAQHLEELKKKSGDGKDTGSKDSSSKIH